ncbi:MAG: hypothetical protein EAX90_01860, partial [Candidatus Heimdallarchaeota archaeon]|nr:hypothetical protein [Candidatus Heimdallarchaeota archaeon]
MEITKQFIEVNKNIGKYLNRQTSKINFKVLFQEKESTYEIPEIGKKFGVIYDEMGNLILAKWLHTQSTKEKEYLTEFLLIREGFRVIFKQDITVENPYERLTDIIIQILALLWFCEQKKISFNSLPIIIIKRRADVYKEEGILKSQFWVFFYTKCYQQKLTARKLYHVLIKRVKDAITEKKMIEELAWDLLYWMKAYLPEEESDLLPIYIQKKRHYKIIQALSQVNYEEGSALKICEILGRSHNTVIRDYQQIMDKYEIFWYHNINLIRLKLYPYFFRIDFKDKETREKLIEKIIEIRYMKYIRQCEIQEETSLIGWLEGPLIITEQIVEYLERLKRKELIADYYVKQIRRKRITWTMTTKVLEPTEETYKELLSGSNKSDYHTMTAIDENYSLTEYEKDKKEIFHEELLAYITTLFQHFLGKTYYLFRPVEVIYELTEKKGIDSKDLSKMLYYVSQLDIRSRRLGLFNYFLYFQEIHIVKYGLFVEINIESNLDLIEKLLAKLENLKEIVRMDLMDKIILIFPYVKYNSLIRQIIENLLKEKKLKFQTLQINLTKGLTIVNTDYVDAYDFEQEHWKT